MSKRREGRLRPSRRTLAKSRTFVACSITPRIVCDEWGLRRSNDWHATVTRARPFVRRAIHGGSRHLHRQHRPALDRGSSWLLRKAPAVGGERLRAHLRGLLTARGEGGRPLRAAPVLYYRARDLYRFVAGVRACSVGCGAGRRPRRVWAPPWSRRLRSLC